MKLLNKSSLRTVKNLIGKLFFITQVMIICVSLPALYYVSVTHTDSKKTEETIIRTNKGKMIINKSDAVVFDRPYNRNARA